MKKKYDVLVIGAGMSGLAAGIRLALFGKKVCIIERHSIPGGLNSYYKRGKRLFDVGLHALTNFMRKGEKGLPFGKILKQLRLSYDQFFLKEQSYSKILFPEQELNFNNDFNLLLQEIHEKFPADIDDFRRLVGAVKSFDELDLSKGYQSAKKVVSQYIKNPLLSEMIFCPILLYGSAWENDMDFAQFVVMFKSLYLQGLSRPEGGVRRIIDLLVEQYKKFGGEVFYSAGVEKIIVEKNCARKVVLSNEMEIEADHIISSMGLPETLRLCQGHEPSIKPRPGVMTFTECLLILKEPIPQQQLDASIVFYNNSSKHHYQEPQSFIDPRSAVLCCPDNFEGHREPGNWNGMQEGEGLLRLTFMANYHFWKNLASESYKVYKQEKEKIVEETLRLIKNIVPDFSSEVVFKDIFTPRTVERYTSHLKGAVYGSLDKTRDGTTPIQHLYICGSDQGFLGIVGAILSGITIANKHCLARV